MNEQPNELQNTPELPSAEEQQPQIELEASQAEVESTFVQQVQADQVTITSSLVGSISAEGSVQAFNSLIASMAVGDKAHLEQGGVFLLTVGGDADFSEGKASVTVAGGDTTLEHSSAKLIVAGNAAHVKNSFVGVLLARQAELGEGSQVLLNTPQAIAFGAAAGLVLGLVQLLSRRKKKKR